MSRNQTETVTNTMVRITPEIVSEVSPEVVSEIETGV